MMGASGGRDWDEVVIKAGVVAKAVRERFKPLLFVHKSLIIMAPARLLAKSMHLH